MRYREIALQEVNVPRSQFNKITKDPAIRMGFECEMVFDIPSKGNRETIDPDEYKWEQLTEYLDMSDRVTSSVAEAFDEWLIRKVDEAWREQEDEYIRQYCEDNDLFERDDDGNIIDEEGTLDKYRDEAREQWLFKKEPSILDKYDMDDWIAEEYGSNTRVMQEFIISPLYGWDEEGFRIYTEDGISRSEVYEEIAESLRDQIGVSVSVNDKYHGTKKAEHSWYVEPDNSIDDDENGTAGEVVSSVYQLEDGLIAMKRLFDWMDENGHRTNESTGLHINLSIQGKGAEDYDFLKMIIFHDEKYVASLFKRLGNTYAEQMRTLLFGKIAAQFDQLGARSLDPHQIMSGRNLDTALAGLKKLGRALEESFDKYWSIHSRQNGVFEFRSMGNEDYESHFEDIRKRVVNMAYIMRIGSDPKLLAKEYISKVYAILSARRYDDANVKAELPPQLSSFARLLAGYGEIITLYQKPLEFLTSLGRVIMKSKTRLTPQQVHQLKAYTVRMRVTPQDLREVVPDDLYNTIARPLGWPLAIRNDDERQSVLPFAMRGGYPYADDDKGAEDDFEERARDWQRYGQYQQDMFPDPSLSRRL